MVRNSKPKTERPLYIPSSTRFHFVLLVASFLAFSLLVAMVGFSSLAVRGEANLDGSNNPLNTVLNILLRAVPAVSTMIVLMQMKHKDCKWHFARCLILLALLSITLAANNPISMSRFWTAAVYLGLLVSALPDKWMDNGRLDVMIIVALIVVFPLMSAFKTMSFDAFVQSGRLESFNVISSFASIDFDAYSMVCRAFEYVDSSGLAYGRQLVSVLFFFVPRSVLPIKGIPTGELIAASQNQVFTNLSAPPMVEGLVDFGWVGITVYGLLVGYLFKAMDSRYWNESYRAKRGTRLYTYFYLVLFGFVMFLMRGALQPTFLRFMGFELFVMLIGAFCSLTRNKLNWSVSSSKRNVAFSTDGSSGREVVKEDRCPNA